MQGERHNFDFKELGAVCQADNRAVWKRKYGNSGGCSAAVWVDHTALGLSFMQVPWKRAPGPRMARDSIDGDTFWRFCQCAALLMMCPVRA
jgi:hypothetical protein